MIWGFLIGIGVGVCVTALVTRQLLDRSVRRTRIAERRARSAERLAEIGSMTSGLAHEIKNPLSTIGLNAQLLVESIEDLEIEDRDRVRIVRRIESLRNETERLRGILEDFLEYAGELRLSLRDVDLNDVLEQLADFLHVQAESAGVRIRLETPPLPSNVQVDPDQIKQALLNLILNAMSAMGDQASDNRDLILRTEPVKDENKSDHVVIHVIDTGPGMDEETRNRVFHPYFTTKTGGTGLGLPAARRIVEAHHGRIELHTEPGKGTDFSIILPVSQDSGSVN